MTWGQAGTPPNEKRPNYMNTVHAMPSTRTVALRCRPCQLPNAAVDENGKSWRLADVRRPYSIMLTEDQHLWIADGTTPQKFTKSI